MNLAINKCLTQQSCTGFIHIQYVLTETIFVNIELEKVRGIKNLKSLTVFSVELDFQIHRVKVQIY